MNLKYVALFYFILFFLYTAYCWATLVQRAHVHPSFRQIKNIYVSVCHSIAYILLFYAPLCFCSGLDFHEDLHRIGAKEGLKGRKLQKAMESYAWNITVLKVSG